jgi:hypothetical protein
MADIIKTNWMNTTSLDYFIGTVSWNNKDNKTTKLIVKNTSITINPSCLIKTFIESWIIIKTSHYPWHVWEDNAYMYNIFVYIYIYMQYQFNAFQWESVWGYNTGCTLQDNVR